MSDSTVLYSTGATGTGPWRKINSTGPVSLHIVETAAAGAVTSTTIVEVSNDGVNALPAPAWASVINAVTPAGDGFNFVNGFAWIRARVTAISADSTVVVHLGA